LKGEIFVALMAHLEDALGYEVLDQILVKADLPSGGAYTSVGFYSYTEALDVVALVAAHLGAPAPALVRGFGDFLFDRLALHRPDVLAEAGSTFALLPQVEDVIHRDVRKLYPEAELPQLEVEQMSDGSVVLHYQSSRPFADLAHGLLEGAVRHFGETMAITREDLEGEPGTHARFVLVREA
jgi:hypothetical protein